MVRSMVRLPSVLFMFELLVFTVRHQIMKTMRVNVGEREGGRGEG